jgi:hypothetical protein
MSRSTPSSYAGRGAAAVGWALEIMRVPSFGCAISRG